MESIDPNTSIRNCAANLLAICMLIAVPALGDYAVTWHTIDGGGGQSSGGPYMLTGTIGQPDADWSSGEEYEVLGGFWPGGPLCFVGFDDFARFAQYWLYTGDDMAADLYEDGIVDFEDMRELADLWLFSCPHDWPLR